MIIKYIIVFDRRQLFITVMNLFSNADLQMATNLAAGNCIYYILSQFSITESVSLISLVADSVLLSLPVPILLSRGHFIPPVLHSNPTAAMAQWPSEADFLDFCSTFPSVTDQRKKKSPLHRLGLFDGIRPTQIPSCFRYSKL